MKRTLAGVVAAVFVMAGCTTGQGVGSGAPASPKPASTPTATPPSAAPSTQPTPGTMAIHQGPLVAGTYQATPFAQSGSDACFVPPQPGCIDSTNDDSIRVTFTVPDGWSGNSAEGVWPTNVEIDAAERASLFFVRGASLYDDPCRIAGTEDVMPEVPVGPTVDDFADAVAAHPLLDVTTPIDVTLAGYSGKYLELQVPSDISGCGVYRPWEPWYYAQGPGELWHLWILDVSGVRVVVQGMDHAGTSAQHRAELQAIVKSIRIEP